MTGRHKARMTAVAAELLLPSSRRLLDAQAVALAIDGAIVHAQYAENPEAALSSLARL